MEEMKLRKGIYYPLIGLVSIMSSYLMGTSSTGLNVHSGEIFIWISILLILGIAIPTVLFVKSLEIVRFKLEEEKSKIKTYSTLLTYALGITLLGMLIFLMMTTLG
jgi:hypothetical protein